MENFLANQGLLLFLVASIEALVIIVLAVYIFYHRQDLDNERMNTINMSTTLNQRNKNIDYWRNMCFARNREVEELKREITVLKGQDANSNQLHNNLHNNPNIKGHTKPLYNDIDDYVTKEREKIGIYVQETTNDDGTIRSDINFDNTDDKPASVSISQKFEYLEAANGGQFRKLLPSDEKCFFRTWEEKGIRKFEFHGNVDKALANINAIFDDVCEIEGKQNGASNISNVEPGILNDQLMVEKRAKIKLT